MGFHYINPALIDDPYVDPSRSEGLLQAPKRSGDLRENLQAMPNTQVDTGESVLVSASWQRRLWPH